MKLQPVKTRRLKDFNEVLSQVIKIENELIRKLEGGLNGYRKSFKNLRFFLPNYDELHPENLHHPRITWTLPRTKENLAKEQFSIWFEEIPCQMETYNELLDKMGNGTIEVHEWLDLSQKNPDIPDAIHSYEQGQSERRNEHLDYQGLNDRDFRQRCVVYNGSLYWLYLKAPVNFKVPFYLDAKWIADKLEVDFDVGIKISQAFIGLGFSKTQCLDMLFKDCIYWEHIRIPIKTDGVKLAEMLDAMLTEMGKVTVEWTNCINSADVEAEYLKENGIRQRPDSPFYEWDRMEEDEDGEYCAEYEGNYPTYEWTDEQFKSVFPNDKLDNILNNLFGAHRLYHENEGLSHEFLTMIRLASMDKIRQIQADMFPRKYVHYASGEIRIARAKYHYLTKSQKAQAWVYINDRKSQLKKAAKLRPSRDAQVVLRCVRQFGRCSVSSALIYAWMNQRPFNWCGAQLTWSQKPDSAQVGMVWDEYKKMK